MARFGSRPNTGLIGQRIVRFAVPLVAALILVPLALALAAERRDGVRPAAKAAKPHGGGKKAAKGKPCRPTKAARKAGRTAKCKQTKCRSKLVARKQRCTRKLSATAQAAADSAYGSAVLADGPRAYWRLGDASGTVARDEMGAFAGAYTGGPVLGRPGALAGDPDTAAGLDGVNDHVRVPDAAGLDFTDTFTLEAWIKRSSTGGTRAIVDKGETSYSFRLAADGSLILRKNAVGTLATSNRTIADTTGWHHVAAVKSPTAVKLYLDGQDVTGPTVTQHAMANTATALAIGASDGGTNYFLPATLDEVAIYPTALTPARIRAHHTAGTAAPQRPTIISLTFDDAQATQFQTRQPLKDHGMHATYYVNSGDVCTFDCPWDFSMPWDQIEALAADGNEIGGHTVEHVDLTDPALSREEKRQAICDDRTELLARGFDPVSFAYPYTRHDATARELVQECGYNSGRGGGGATVNPETIPPLNAYGTRTASLGPGEMTLSAMQDVILRAEEVSGGWTQFIFHGVCDNACTDGWVRPSTFSALLDWLEPRAAHGTVVKTVREVIGGPSAPPPPPPPPPDETAPDTSITGGPSGTVTDTSASFTFTASEAGAAFACKLDAGAWESCTSPKAYSALATGQHTFSVRASDAAGNVDASPDTRSWTVEPPPPPPPPAGYSAVVLADGPRAYWRLGDASGTLASEETGSFPGTYTGGPVLGRPGAIPGDTNTAAGFDGVNDHVRVPDATGLDLTDTFTLEAWVKRSATGGTRTIIDKGETSYSFRLAGDGSLLLRKNAVATLATSTRTVADTTAWHHVAAVKSPTSVKLYLDGQDVTGPTVTQQTMANTATALTIGGSDGGTNYFLPATLDEVAIYPTALSTARVQAHHAAGVDTTPRPPAPTTVSLTFDDAQATQYHQARGPLQSHGMDGTFFVNTGDLCVGSCSGAYHMTWAQVHDLAADGNEIGGHTLNHIDLEDPTIPLAEKRRQICDDRQALITEGLDPVSFAYPYSNRDATAIALVQECGYNSARIVGGANTTPETIPPGDRFQTETPSFGDGEMTLAQMQDAITRAEQGDGGWVQLVFHGICDSVCNEGWVKPATFNALLDWLAPRAAHGTVVKTVRQVIGGPSGPPPPPPTLPGYREAVMADGPRAYWRLGDTGTTVARDETGVFAGAYTGGPVLGRPGALTGDANTAATFDGVNDHVRVPDAAGLDLTDTFTLEAWVKRSSTGGTRTIIDKGETSYSFRLAANGSLLLRKNAVATLATSTTPITDTTAWHHVAAVKSPTTVKLYIDGQDVTGAVTQQTMANTATALTLGGSDGGTNYFLPATLDEVAIYPTALSAARIQAHRSAAGG
jgi:peptidoglycan/xylan/chitin deacetylase (PgdA/CDA1 family)